EEETVTRDEIQAAEALAKKYHPFIDLFRGKKWIFYPRALKLPAYANGNIFRLRDGRVMITMVSAWRQLRHVQGYTENLEVLCHLPDASHMNRVRATAIDLDEAWDLNATRDGDMLTLTVPRHAKATAVILSSG
ncbi:MAG: hypothetical protein ACRDHZ_25465, partial [Ktedonobacteraceae bacterium]